MPGADTTVPEWSAATRPRRRRGWLGGALTVLIVAGVLAYLFLRAGDPLHVQAASVAPAIAPGCDTAVDVVGTITTNGRPGVLTYRWQRSDGQTSAVLTQTVDSGATTAPVHLQWSFTGRGIYPATATLHVLAPDPVDAAGTFTYACR